MRSFKQWIAWLFNIKAEDLLEKTGTTSSERLLSSKIQEEINRQVERQLQRSIQRVVLPEVQKIISIQISQTLHQVSALETEQVENTMTGAISAPQSAGLDEVVQPQTVVPVENREEKQTIPSPLPETITQSGTFARSEEPLPIEEEITPLDAEIAPIAEHVHAKDIEVPAVSLLPITEQEIRIGIDFGTTTTAISIKIGDERPEALPIGLDGTTRYMPSIVYFRPGGGELTERAIIGEEAESFGDPTHIIRSVKRCFGCIGRNCRTNDNGNGITAPFPWCKGDGKIHISDTEAVQPSQIAYLIIKETLQRAVKVVRDRKQIDLTTENICSLSLNLGCGAQFGLNQREIICSIARELGFSNINIDNIVEEPILAGFTFSRFAEQPEGRALIYDFGGGTFDVAVLDVDRFQQNHRVTVVATAGENWLGGDDIDSLVYDYFLLEAAKEVGLSISEVDSKLGSIDRSKLRLLARRAKEALSQIDSYSDVLLAQNLGLLNLDLSRNKFEELLEASGIVSKSLRAVERACKLVYAFENAQEGQTLDSSAIIHHRIYDAALKISRVILVGGVTKIPYIRNRLKEIFGEEKIVQDTVIEPISAVAIGGAYPRDPQHYSICVPPFGFYLEYERSTGPDKYYQVVLEPYEYYDFHKLWASGIVGVYSKEFDLPVDYLNVKIVAKRISEKEPLWINNLGKLEVGKWRFSVTLEGSLEYSKVGRSPTPIPGYPIIHPIQKAIRDARERRQKKEREKADATQGNYDDWMKRMMTEN